MGSLASEQALKLTSRNLMDYDEFRRQGHMIVDFLADYFKTIEDQPVMSRVEPGYLRQALPEFAPHGPEPIESVLDDINKHIVPGLMHWQSPNFFGYYPITASTAGILGDLLCSGFNVVSFGWVASPAATELENIVMDWLGKMLKLPEPFLFSGGGGGVIHGNTCEAIICTMTAARDRVLREMGEDKVTNLVVYCSDQTHFSFRKAAHIVGIQNIREIETTMEMEFGMCPNALRRAVEADVEAGLVPLYLCVTVGTTSTCAIDPVKELCRVVAEYGVWVHIDAALAGAACICPEYRHIIDGIESVNSFSFNAHKWLLAGLDCCCVWLKDPAALTQALSYNAEYLRNKPSESKKSAVVDYKNWQISLSRRFRAVRLWLVLRSNGVANLRKHIHGHVSLAKLFEELVGSDRRFEVFCRRRLNLVCFRISPSALVGSKLEKELEVNEVNKRLLDRINESGRAFMTHTVVAGVYVIRIAVGATLVEERHVRIAWKLVQHHADAILFN